MRKTTRRRRPPCLQVIVTVRGGVADVLFKSRGVAVALHDYDVQGSDEGDPGIARDPDGRLCCIREWEPTRQVASNEDWPVVRKALEGVYSRPWKCPDCGRLIDCSYEELAEAGPPICPDCDTGTELT